MKLLRILVYVLLSYLLVGTSLGAYQVTDSKIKVTGKQYVLKKATAKQLVLIKPAEERFDIGDLDSVLLQGLEFEAYDTMRIEFYKGDLDRDGNIYLQGFLSSNHDDIPVEDIVVEATVDGGETWTKATGHEEWDWSFKPEIGVVYEFALRVVEDKLSLVEAEVTEIELTAPLEALAIGSIDDDVQFAWNHEGATKYKLVITDAGGNHKHSYETTSKIINQNLIDMIDIDGNELKWHIEAYSDADALVATSQDRTLYFPDMAVSASLAYMKNNIPYDTSIENDTITISSATSAKLNGFVKNSTSNNMTVAIVVNSDVNTPMTKSIIIPPNVKQSFSFENIIDLLSGDETTISLTFSKTENILDIQREFIVSKTEKPTYKIGAFTLVTGVDVLPVNGKITGSGYIKADILKKFKGCDTSDATKGCGKLPITFSDLEVDSSGKITQTIEYVPASMLISHGKSSITASKVTFSANEAHMIATIKVKKLGEISAPLTIVDTNIPFQVDKFAISLELDWSTEEDGALVVPVWGSESATGYPLSIRIKKANLNLDIKREWWNMVHFTISEGGIKFGGLFDESATSISIDTNGALKWDLTKTIDLVGNSVKLKKGTNGIISVLDEEKYMTIQGKARIYLVDKINGASDTANLQREHIDIDLTDKLKASSEGLKGTIDISYGTSAYEGTKPQIAGIPLNLKKVRLIFDGGLTAGGLTFGVHYDDFFKSGTELDFDISASMSGSGVGEFSINTTGNGEISVTKPGFAIFTLSNLNLVVGNGENSNTFQTDMKIKVLAAGGQDTELTFTQLTLDKDGVKVGSVAVWQSLGDSDAGFNFSGVNMQLTKIGFGVVAKDGQEGVPFIGLGGSGALGGDTIQVSDIEIAIYGTSDVSMGVLNSPMVTVKSNIVSFEGSMSYIDTASIKGFTATALLTFPSVGSGLAIESELMLGSFSSNGQETGTYWRVYGMASSGSFNFPLAPIPLSLYGFGGGIGYNVAYSASERKFVPEQNGEVVVTIATVIGTSDQGYTTHGPAKLSFSTGGQITFNTTMYINSTLGSTPPSPKREVEGLVTMSVSPFRVYLNADADITMVKKEVIEIKGNAEMLYSSSDSYIHIGTKASPISAKFLGLGSQSYMTLDNKGFGLGCAMSYDSGKVSAYGFYGQLSFGASIDMMIGARPFYIDAEGKIWGFASAGLSSIDYEILRAGVNIAARFRMPNPTYAKLDIEAYYSVLNGAYEGNYEATYWIGDKPSVSELQPTRAKDFDMIKYVLPIKDQAEVSRYPTIEIYAKVPLLVTEQINLNSFVEETQSSSYELFLVGNSSTMLGTYGDTEVPNNGYPADQIPKAFGTSGSDFFVLKDLTSGSVNKAMDFSGGLQGYSSKKLIFRATRALEPGHEYEISFMTAVKNSTTNRVIGMKTYHQKFSVTTNEEVSFMSLVESVYPKQSAKSVYKQSPLFLRMKADDSSNNGTGSTSGIEVNLYDPLDRKVGSAWQFMRNDVNNQYGGTGSQAFAYTYANHPDLKPFVMYECVETGEKMEAIVVSGFEKNPLIEIEEERQANASSGVTAVANASSGVTAVANAEVTTMETSSGCRIEVTRKRVGRRVITSTKEVCTPAASARKARETAARNKAQAQETANGRTYKRIVLTKYSIKATQDTNGSIRTFFSSTFDVNDNKNNSNHQNESSYDTDIDMISQSGVNPKFSLTRAVIDYTAKQADWDRATKTYTRTKASCKDRYEGYFYDDDELEPCLEAASLAKTESQDDITARYSKGNFKDMYFSFEFDSDASINAENIILDIQPGCDGIGTGHHFSNAQGRSEYQVVEASNGFYKVKLNISQNSRISEFLYHYILDNNRAGTDNTVDRCGRVWIKSRGLVIDADGSGFQDNSSSLYGDNKIMTPKLVIEN